jgi:hypothetical protein
MVGKGGQSVRLTAYHFHVPTVFESGSLSLLEFLYFLYPFFSSLKCDLCSKLDDTILSVNIKFETMWKKAAVA